MGNRELSGDTRRHSQRASVFCFQLGGCPRCTAGLALLWPRPAATICTWDRDSSWRSPPDGGCAQAGPFGADALTYQSPGGESRADSGPSLFALTGRCQGTGIVRNTSVCASS